MFLRRLYILLALFLFAIPSRGEETFDCQQVIYNFLVRYVNDLRIGTVDNISPEQKMKSDKVMTIYGNYRLLPESWEELDLSVLYYENRGYEAVWKLRRDTLWHIIFPNSYELILGKTRYELEIMLRDDIMNTLTEYEYVNDSVSIMPISDSIYVSQKNKVYLSKKMSTTAYYKFNTEGRLELLRDVFYPKQLAINLCQFPLFRDLLLSITQNIYDSTRSYTLPLAKWLSYCQQQECVIYVGVETEGKELLKMLVICENKSLGYNHMLSVLFPIRDGSLIICNPINVSLTAYIPTYNIIKD